MAGALEGIRVVELTSMITGPYAAMILADQGAEVIKIEPPGIGDVMRYLGSQRGGISSLFASCNRGKRSVTLNLREEAGQQIVRELANEADVFLQNFRPGVVDRLGLGEPVLRKTNPDLIYTSLNAFGEKGSHAKRPAYDHILQGMIGAGYVQGDPPQYMRQTWVDKATAVYTAQAITAALFARSNGKGGQHLRLSMLDVGLSFLWPDAHADTMIVGDEGAVRVPPIAATYVPTETADGFATVAAVTEQQVTNLLIAVGKEDLLVDPRFSSRDAIMQNLDAFRQEMIDAGGHLSTEDLIARLQEADVPVGPLLRLDEVPGFEPIVENEMLIESEHPQMGAIREPRPPARFENTPSEISRPAPALGADTESVLQELGHDGSAIDKWRAGGVLG